MANTYVDYTAVASQTDYNFSFEYLRDEHVKVKVDDVIVTNYTIVTSPTPTKIRFNTAPSAGAEIRIYRDSRGDFSPLVDFVDGSVLTENELDEAYRHNLFVSQEASEGTGNELLNKKGGANYDAEGNKIINLGTPTADGDAASKAYTDQTIDNAIALGGSPAIVSLGGYDVTASLSTTARTLADRFADVANVLDYGATGNGTDDDTASIQAAIDANSSIYFPEGNYLISNRNTLTYRSSITVNVGLTIPSNRTLIFAGINTKFTVADSTRAVVFASSSQSKISLKGSFSIEGNASNQTDPDLVGFGVYLLNCSDIEIDTIHVNETKSNTVQIMGCSDVSIRHIHSTTTSAGGSGGGGPQFEDCTKVTASTFSGYTYDDLVSVISHGATINDFSLGEINGGSENARALFMGLSNTATGQHSIFNITATVNSYDCGVNGLTSAVTINNGAIYRNINVSVFDRSSYAALRVTPYDSTNHGTLEACTFNVVSHNSDTHAVEFRHDDDVNTVIKNNKLNAIVVNPNYIAPSYNTEVTAGNFQVGVSYQIVDAGTTDFTLIGSADNNEGTIFTATGSGTGTGTANTGLVYSAIRIEGGDAWDIQANVDYPSGKTFPTNAIQLGASGTYRKVTNSILGGVVNGGKPNLTLTSADNINLDNLICVNTEDANDISIDLTANASNTRVSSLSRDGEINDVGTGTQRSMSKLFASTTEVASSSTTQTDLISYTLPADWMGKTGVLHYKALGTITGTNGTKVIEFNFGTQGRTLLSDSFITTTPLSGDWIADIWIFQDGTRASQKLIIEFVLNGSIIRAISTTGSADTTGAVDIKITGECGNAADSITQEALFIQGS
jgi:hypothetical protein